MNVLAPAMQQAEAPPTPASARPQARHSSPIGNQALLRRLQAKLTIGDVDDPLEHEADAVAEQVMRMPDPALGFTPAAPRICRKCDTCEEKDAKKIQTKRADVSTERGEEPASVDAVLKSSGQPLDQGLRNFFEPRFGADFSNVRVHQDAHAADSARDVGALAYTVGNNIVFGCGQYAPREQAGHNLIAHELAHVVQQDSGTLHRRVASVTCQPGTAGAPADPRHDLETADRQAIDLSTQMAAALATDSTTVRGRIPATPSATLTSFQNHFGLPPASGTGFLNRLTGAVRPSREVALSEELATVSQRFAGVARLMTQGLSYQCTAGSLKLVGCSIGSCADGDAFSCPGNSLVALCSAFWTDFNDTARAQILIHESLHIQFGFVLDATTRGSGRNFNIANCYEALIADGTGADSHAICPAPP